MSLKVVSHICRPSETIEGPSQTHLLINAM